MPNRVIMFVVHDVISGEGGSIHQGLPLSVRADLFYFSRSKAPHTGFGPGLSEVIAKHRQAALLTRILSPRLATYLSVLQGSRSTLTISAATQATDQPVLTNVHGRSPSSYLSLSMRAAKRSLSLARARASRDITVPGAI